MDGLSHIFLHVALCNAIARQDPDTEIAMHVTMGYQIGDPALDKTFRFRRGDDSEAVVEFDVPRGVFRMQLDVPKYDCSAATFVSVLADQNREISQTLVDRASTAAPGPLPVLLLEGTAPVSFEYVKPTYVFFDGSLACNQPVPAPLPARLDFEYDQGAYYLALYPGPALTAGNAIFALRLRTTTGLAHYVRVHLGIPIPAGGWPGNVHFDISEDMVDQLATEKPDTLLCPKLWETIAG
jgi:hypothetical protein